MKDSLKSTAKYSNELHHDINDDDYVVFDGPVAIGKGKSEEEVAIIKDRLRSDKERAIASKQKESASLVPGSLPQPIRLDIERLNDLLEPKHETADMQVDTTPKL